MNRKGLCEFSGFRREAYENCALLGYYAGSSGNSLPTFGDSRCVIAQKSAVIRKGIESYLCVVQGGDIAQAVSSQRVFTTPGLNEGPFLVRFTVHKVAMRQVHVRLLRVPTASIISPVLHAHIDNNTTTTTTTNAATATTTTNCASATTTTTTTTTTTIIAAATITTRSTSWPTMSHEIKQRSFADHKNHQENRQRANRFNSRYIRHTSTWRFSLVPLHDY